MAEAALWGRVEAARRKPAWGMKPEAGGGWPLLKLPKLRAWRCESCARSSLRDPLPTAEGMLSDVSNSCNCACAGMYAEAEESQ